MAALIPEDLDFAERASVVIERSRVVDGTVDEVWAVLVDHERWPRWFPALKSCTATSDPPSGVGSTRTVALAGGLSVDERFIAWDEPSVWAFTGVAGPPIWERLVERVTLEPVGEAQARIVYRMAIGPKRGLGLLTKAMGAGTRKALGQALENLDDELARRRTS